VKSKAATNGGKRRALTAASVVRTRGRRSVCDGLDVIRRRRREVNPPGHNPRFLLSQDILGQNPVGIFVEN